MRASCKDRRGSRKNLSEVMQPTAGEKGKVYQTLDSREANSGRKSGAEVSRTLRREARAVSGGEGSCLYEGQY